MPPPSTVELLCPKRGASGEAVWESEKSGPCLARLSANFHERLAKFAPYKIEIACHDCGVVARAFGAQGPLLAK